MKEFTLHAELWLPRRRDEVFAFFADAHNLQTPYCPKNSAGQMRCICSLFAFLTSIVRAAVRGLLLLDPVFFCPRHPLPGATILSITDGKISKVRLEETSHYQITRGILENPKRYWHHLLKEDQDVGHLSTHRL